MKMKYLPSIVTLTAAAVACIVCIVRENEVLYSTIALAIVIVVFFIIGTIAKSIIMWALLEDTEVKKIQIESFENVEKIDVGKMQTIKEETEKVDNESENSD